MSEKGRRFISVGDRIPHGHRTVSKPRQLRKNVPHPVRLLPASPNLRERLIVDACLRFDESIEVSHATEEHRTTPIGMPFLFCAFLCFSWLSLCVLRRRGTRAPDIRLRSEANPVREGS